jgi:nicotinamide riboside kinase
MVTRMYAEFYAKDESCELTAEEFEKIASVADELTRKSRWDKIFLLVPNGKFVDDHTRFMKHSGMFERGVLCGLLVNAIKRSGNWDKVTVLNGGYWENFKTVVTYVREVMNR